MSLTDPIADMLTSIRNAAGAKHARVDVPGSKVREEIAKALLREKFIKSYRRLEDNKQGILRIYLRYDPEVGSVIQHLKRVSKPGRRVYVNKTEVPRIQNGLGSAILSTTRGVLTDREAREAGVGGELIAEIW